MKVLFKLCLMSLFVGCASDDSNNGGDPPESNRTTITDTAFEEVLIDVGIDDTLDGSVLTSSIDNVTDLLLNDKGISNMNGLQDFSGLINLWLNDNMVTSLNVSGNQNLKFIFADNNMLSGLNVTGLDDLEKISLKNNQVTTINVASSSNLQLLDLENNDIDAIDVSNNSSLTQLNVVGNPLTCIRVNADQFMNTPVTWVKDADDDYALTCN